MAITNLTGTGWWLGEFSSSANNTWNINFYTEDGGVREYWKQIVATSNNTMNYVSTDGTSVSVFYQGAWAGDYRWINITGGSQATTSSCISWIQSKGTFIYGTIRDYRVNREEVWLVTSTVSAVFQVIDKTKTSYQALPTLSEINNLFNDYDYVQLAGIFSGCSNMTTSPTIPNYQGKCYTYANLYSNCTSLTTGPTFSDTNPVSCYNMYKGCTSLVSPTLPSNVDEINYCFSGCTSLQTFNSIPSGITSMYETFKGCTSLTSVGTIPTGVTAMRSCFRGCTSLTTAPNLSNCTSLTNLYQTFEGCSNLASMPALPNSVTDMGRCFYGCTNLQTTSSFAMPSALTDADYCFYGCRALINPPNFSACSNLTTSDSCFYGCLLLTTMPDLSGCTSLTDMHQMFFGCDALVNVTAIPATVTSLEKTFMSCVGLVTAPDLSNAVAVTNMKSTFDNCVRLENVTTDLSHMTGLVDLNSCFCYCVSLVTAPTIPSTVVDVSDCFSYSNIQGILTVNSDNITAYTRFLSGIFSAQPLKLTGSASNTILNNLASTGGTQIYVNTDSSLNYANPVIPTFTLVRCNQDGTINPNGLYAKASFTFNYFKSGTPHDISGRFINNISPITAIINGISNSISIVYDENNQQYNLSDITDFTKTYHFIIANTNQTSIVMRLQTADTYNASNIKQATLDIANVVNTYLKYKDENNTINIFYPTTPANNVTLLNSGFTYANVEDIIWNELFRKE